MNYMEVDTGESFEPGELKDEPDRHTVMLQPFDFVAYMPSHQYIYRPTGELWPAVSVNARVAPTKVDGKDVAAAAWIDQNLAVEQMTWAPGLPEVIRDRLVSDGGWRDHEGASTYNLYKPPTLKSGDAKLATRWVDHVRLIYPDEADRIIQWLAHRVQRPHEKINYGIVLGGSQGIGKDTMLEPVKHTVGAWNFVEVTPQQLLGRFNSFVKSVIMRISEARDLGTFPVTVFTNT
jgi:hypothetical protein